MQLDKDQINDTMFFFSQAERKMTDKTNNIYTNRLEFELADKQCQQALCYARIYKDKEEEKTGLMCETLKI